VTTPQAVWFASGTLDEASSIPIPSGWFRAQALELARLATPALR
jgi:hypothetical protein